MQAWGLGPEDCAALRSCDVAVIGAGAAGLVTARQLLREGHKVTVFEQDANIGGVWNYSEAAEEDLLGLDPTRERIHSSLYASVRTNLPREIMSFSDWPFIPAAMHGKSIDSRRFCKHEEVQRFLEVFAEEFDILPHIRFNCRVTSVEPLRGAEGPLPSSTRWRLRLLERALGLKQEQEFDAVVCCIGTYSQPNVPQIPGIDSFPGLQMHCHNFRRPHSFRGQQVLVVGGAFSGDEISRQISDEAEVVFHTAWSWPTETYDQPRKNLVRMAWLSKLTPEGQAVFEDGERRQIDSIVYCTGYKYSFPFLEDGGLVSTDDGHVHAVYKHIFLPSNPSLCFVGLLWKTIRFPQFELQATLVAKVLSGRAELPSRAAMEADVARHYEELRRAGIPLRHAHSQSERMPENQWQYNDSLAAAAKLTPTPDWRRRLHALLAVAIFGRPDTFRDVWLEEERAAYEEAERICAEALSAHRKARSLSTPERRLSDFHLRLSESSANGDHAIESTAA